MKYLVCFLVLLIGTILQAEDNVYSFSNGEQITLRIPDPSNKLTKLPRPSHGIGGCSCLMCTGNHLLGAHKIPYSYLSKIGYSQWYTLHNNLHNSEDFKGHVGGGALAYGYNTPFPKSTPTPSVFAPTPVDVIYRALREANIKETDVLYDLGCGDGRVLVVASKLFGCRSVGIDIDKECVEWTKENIKLNGLEKLAKVIEGDVTKVDISKATVVFLYLQPELSKKIKGLEDINLIIAHDKTVEQLKPMSELKFFSAEDNRPHIIFYKQKKIGSSTDFL